MQATVGSVCVDVHHVAVRPRVGQHWTWGGWTAATFATLLGSPSQVQLLRNMAIIDRLRTLATGEGRDPGLADELRLSDAAQKYFETADGSALVGKWTLRLPHWQPWLKTRRRRGE